MFVPGFFWSLDHLYFLRQGQILSLLGTAAALAEREAAVFTTRKELVYTWPANTYTWPCMVSRSHVVSHVFNTYS